MPFFPNVGLRLVRFTSLPVCPRCGNQVDIEVKDDPLGKCVRCTVGCCGEDAQGCVTYEAQAIDRDATVREIARTCWDFEANARGLSFMGRLSAVPVRANKDTFIPSWVFDPEKLAQVAGAAGWGSRAPVVEPHRTTRRITLESEDEL